MPRVRLRYLFLLVFGHLTFFSFQAPLLSHSPLPFNIQPFPMNASIPRVPVFAYVRKPPLKAEWLRTTLDQLLQRPTVVIYGLIGDPKSEEAVLSLFRSAREWKRLGALVIFRGSDQSEVDRIRAFVEAHHPEIPVAVDLTMEIAFGLMAFQLPSYAIFDRNAVLKVRRIRRLESKLLNQKTLAETLSALEKGGPVPLSDGEYIEDSRTLIGKKAPSVTFAPASLAFAPKTPFNLTYPIAKPTLVVFWMATCPHCQREMPRLAQWWRRNRNAVQLVTATRTGSQELRERTRSYLEERSLTDLPVYEINDSIMASFRVEGIPTWLMIGRDGIIVDVQIGEDDRLYEHLDQALKKCR